MKKLKKLLVLMLVTLSLSSYGCTALKVAPHVVALVIPKVAGVNAIPQVGAANVAKQAAAVNAARKVAAGSVVPQVGAASAVGIASKLVRFIP